MSKYDKLWEYVEKQEGDELVLTFDEIGTIAGVPLDHSFLNYKKELVPHGWEVGKISMKQQTSEVFCIDESDLEMRLNNLQ